MFEFKLQPRLSETDGLGHINNTFLPAWYEEARRDLYKIFIPELNLQYWNLVLKKYEVEIHKQIYHDSTITIQTGIDKIGTKSFTVYQEAFQNKFLVSSAYTVLVYFDFSEAVPANIPISIKDQLELHMTHIKKT